LPIADCRLLAIIFVLSFRVTFRISDIVTEKIKLAITNWQSAMKPLPKWASDPKHSKALPRPNDLCASPLQKSNPREI